MKRLTAWIKDHQIITFFILAFAITWGVIASWHWKAEDQ